MQATTPIEHAQVRPAPNHTHLFDIAGATSQADTPPVAPTAYACLTLPQHPTGARSASKLIAIADGAPGDAPGFASDLALDCLSQYVSAYPPWVDDRDDIECMRHLFQRAFSACQEQLHSAEGPHLANPAASITAVYLRWPDAVVAHAGATRAYLFRDGRLLQQTWDHTLAADMTKRQLPFADVRDAHHVVTNMVGGNRSALDVDLRHLHLEPGDQLLLTNPGLHNSRCLGTMAMCLTNGITAAGACRRLLDFDNKEAATAVVVRLLP